jgi:hypothetical protein
MIRIDIGYHGQHGLQIEERGVGLVGLDYDKFPTAQLGV